MKLVFLILFFVAWSEAILAQSKGKVRSGEHENFSRLVVYLSPEQTWKLEKKSEDYVLIVPGWDEGFDVSSVFERMPKNRIVDLTSDGASLTIKLGCTCRAIAQPFGSEAVIIDVATNESQSETAVVRLPVPQSPNWQSDVSMLDRLQKNVSEHPDLGSLRASIIEALGQTASLSLLQVATPSDVFPAQEAAQQEFRPAPRIMERLQLKNALDLARPDTQIHRPLEDNHVCPDPEYFDVISWGGDVSFVEQISVLRQSLFGEFDETKRPQAVSLARAYLYFGLEFEAAMVVASLKLDGPDIQGLLKLAELLADDLDADQEAAFHLDGCDEALVPWKLLGRQVGAVVSMADADSLLAQFPAWPKHLQELLGYRFVSRLARGGQKTSAQVLENMVTRGDKVRPGELTILSAQTGDMAKGSLSELLKVVEADGENAPQALVMFLRGQMSAGNSIDSSYLDLSEAYEKELSTKAISKQLLETRIKALAYSGETGSALSLLTSEAQPGWIPSDELVEAMVGFISSGESIVSKAEVAIWASENGRVRGIDRRLIEQLIEALRVSGLPGISARLLEQVEFREDLTKMKADIAITRGEYDEAEGILQKMLSPEADSLRADVMILNNRSAHAWDQFSAELPEAARADLAWAASRWDAVPRDGRRGKVASLIAFDPSELSSNEQIASARSIGRVSRESRVAITNLIKAESD